jgi:hypothetical protein
VRDTASNCPSRYRLPLILKYDPSLRVSTPIVRERPTNVCRHSAGQNFTVQIENPKNSYQLKLYTLPSIHLVRRNLNSSRNAYTVGLPFTTTNITCYLYVEDTLTGCLSDTVDAPINVFTPQEPIINCPSERCGPGSVTLTLISSNDGPIYAYNESNLAQPQILQPPDFIFTTPNLTTSSVYYFEKGVFELPNCRSPRKKIAVKIKELGPAPKLASPIKSICKPGQVTFTFEKPNNLNQELYIYNENDEWIDAVSDSTFTYTTPVITTPTRFWAAYYDLQSGCRSEFTRFEVVFGQIPKIDSIIPISPGCQGGDAIIEIRHNISVDSISIISEFPCNCIARKIPATGVRTIFRAPISGDTRFKIQPISNSCGIGEAQTITVPVYPKVEVRTHYEIIGNSGCIIASAAGGSSANYLYTLLDSNLTNTSGRFCNLRPGVYTVRACSQNNPTLNNLTSCCDTKTITILPESCPMQPLGFRISKNPDCNNGYIKAEWNQEPSALRYEIGIRKHLANSDAIQGWQNVPVSTPGVTTYKFMGLEPETYYEARIRVFCRNGLSSEYFNQLFYTDICNTPNKLIYSKINNNTGKILITQNDVQPCNPMVYHFCYAPSREIAPLPYEECAEMKRYNTIFENEQLVSLTPDGKYIAAARMVCYGGSVLSNINRELEFTHNLRLSGTKKQANTDFLLYPNPNKGRFTLSYNGEEAASYRLQIVNPLGGAVYEKELEAQNGGNEWK